MKREISPSPWYELRMLLVTYLVSLTMLVAPKRSGGMRLILTFKKHYEREIYLREEYR